MTRAATFQHLAGDGRENPACWRVAYGLLLLIPWMLLYSRAGMEIATALIGVLFLARSAMSRDWTWTSDAFFRTALLGWAWLLLTSALAQDAWDSLARALPWVRYVLLFTAMRYWLLPNKTAIALLGATLAVLATFCGIDTIWQYATGVSLTGHPVWESGRLTGPLTTPKIGIFMAKFLLPALVLPLVFATERRTVLAVLAGSITCIVSILLTGERVAFLMAFSALLLMGGLVAWRERRVRRAIVACAAVLMAATLLMVMTQPWVQLSIQRTVTNLSDFRESSYGHVATAALLVAAHHPLAGVGYNGFRDRYTDYIEFNGNEKLPAEHFLHPHNPYLEWLTSAGIPGLLIFAAMVTVLLRDALRALPAAKGIEIIVPASMLGGWMLNFFPLMPTQSYFSNWPGIMLFYSLGALYALQRITYPAGK